MEHRSFEQIYLQYYKPVYAYLMTLCQNEELAAELTLHKPNTCSRWNASRR